MVFPQIRTQSPFICFWEERRLDTRVDVFPWHPAHLIHSSFQSSCTQKHVKNDWIRVSFLSGRGDLLDMSNSNWVRRSPLQLFLPKSFESRSIKENSQKNKIVLVGKKAATCIIFLVSSTIYYFSEADFNPNTSKIPRLNWKYALTPNGSLNQITLLFFNITKHRSWV